MTENFDELTRVEQRLFMRLHVVAPTREQRKQRARTAIRDQGKALAAVSVSATGRPINFAEAFQITYGEPL